jgi:hypothetical protein
MACHERAFGLLRSGRMACHEGPFDSLRSLRAFSLTLACHERASGLLPSKLKASRMVEAAGVERELADIFKYLMVLDFWANSRHINDLETAVVFTAVPSNPLISTVFLEK